MFNPNLTLLSYKGQNVSQKNIIGDSQMTKIKVLLLLGLIAQSVYAHRGHNYGGTEKAFGKKGTIDVQVVDKKTKKFTPSRITVINQKGKLVRLTRATKKRTAVRKGIFYFDGEKGQFNLKPGRYQIFAGKGFEWSLSKKEVEIKKNELLKLKFEIERVVDTKGYVASDTHVHVLKYSKHGDIRLNERMVTIAGEGIELPIATDHNHNTDYTPIQKELEFDDHFTPIVGNEVTTRIGHINAFPMDPLDKRPSPYLRTWEAFNEKIREKGAEVLILNHPRWRKKNGNPEGPFGKFGLNRVTGSFKEIKGFPFNALELENSMTPVSKNEPLPFFILKDWMGLLNQGYRVTVVGGSDSHTVAGIVGQARSYVKSSTDNPAEINEEEVVESFKKGRVLVSKGIFSDLSLFNKYNVGDTVSLKDESEIKGTITVRAPGWVKPKEVFVFVNGDIAWKKKITKEEGKPIDIKLNFKVPRPKIDAYLFVYVLGDGISEHYWKTKDPFTMAATNPIFIDVDGDGSYLAPKKLALEWIEENEVSLIALEDQIKDLEPLIGVQVMDILFQKPKITPKDLLEKVLENLSLKSKLFKLYREERLKE